MAKVYAPRSSKKSFTALVRKILTTSKDSQESETDSLGVPPRVRASQENEENPSDPWFLHVARMDLCTSPGCNVDSIGWTSGRSLLALAHNDPSRSLLGLAHSGEDISSDKRSTTARRTNQSLSRTCSLEHLEPLLTKSRLVRIMEDILSSTRTSQTNRTSSLPPRTLEEVYIRYRVFTRADLHRLSPAEVNKRIKLWQREHPIPAWFIQELVLDSRLNAMDRFDVPQSVEEVYVRLDIITHENLETLSIEELNELVERWETACTVSAPYLEELINLWGLQTVNPEIYTISGPREPQSKLSEAAKDVYLRIGAITDESLTEMDPRQITEHIEQCRVLAPGLEIFAQEPIRQREVRSVRPEIIHFKAPEPSRAEQSRHNSVLA
ncbi:hypothetical protein MMC28_000539 [Mycoblastus sanguinarius]|nr:hypothetical protein [Mycoblastus sanguinarius]